MNAHKLSHGQRLCCRSSKIQNFVCAITSAGKLLAGFLWLALAGGGAALAQQNNDCYTVLCPSNQVKWVCSETNRVPLGPYSIVIITNPCPNPTPVAINCVPPPATLVGPGVYPINCTVSAGGVVIAQCAFQVIVNIDNEPPDIHCPSNIVEFACPSPVGPCGTVVNYPAPTASDNSGAVAVTCIPASGSFFPCGDTVVTCTAEDRCENKRSCQFIVRVVEQATPPSIQCPPDITVVTCSNCVVVNYPLPIVGNGVLLGCNPPPTACLPPGIHVVTCVASNDCGRRECQFKITVRHDDVPPTIQCPSNVVVFACPNAAGGCGTIVNYPPPSAADPGGSGVVSVACVPPSGSFFPCGITPVVCTAEDACGNRSSCTFTVEVRPVPPASILCPSNIVVTLPCGSNCVPVFYPPPVVNNGVLIGCMPPSGTCLPVGLHTVTCRASNDCGQVAGCEFTIRVNQSLGQPPSIQCPADITATTCSNCAVVTYPLPVVNNGVLVGCMPPSGTCFQIGISAVTCTASNACGGVASCEFKVTVRHVPPPTILCPSNDIIATVPCGSNCVPVFYPAPVVIGGTLVGCSPPSGACLQVGNYNVTCRATNECGDVAGCEFIIRVIPGLGLPPAIQCPADITATTCSNCAVVNYPLPAVNNGVLVGCMPPSGTCFPIGSSAVTCTASNACGGVASCEFKVTVRQVPPPTILCPSNDIIATVTCGSNCVPVFYPAPVVTGGTLVGCNPPSGTCLPVGIYNVICRATNECGDVAGCEFLIRVLPGHGEPPTIQCPGDVSVLTCSNCAVVTYPAPIVGNGVLLGCTPPSGSCFPLGVNIVTCTATNNCGEAAICEFRVIVREVPPAIIICPEDITVRTCRDCEIVNYPAPTVLNGGLVGCAPPSGFCFPIGSTLVHCVATNRCGERAECRFTVNVRPVPEVGILCPSNIVVTTCTNGVVVGYPPPTLTGSVDPADVFIICHPPSGSFFPLGTNTVTCCVVDRCQRTNCCSFIITVIPGNPCVKPPLNMVLWLPFDEPVGIIAHNIVPGAPNGGHVNGPVPFLGQHVLNSLCFDGINDFVRVPNYGAIVLGGSHFSIDTWALRRDTTGGRRVIVSKVSQVAGGIAGYEFYLNNGIMNLLLRTPAGSFNFNAGAVGLVPLDNNWHFLAVTVQRGVPNMARFYRDGALVAIVPGALAGSVANGSSLYVGSRTFPVPGDFFQGYLDEVEIFRRILTPVEINQLWLAGKAGKCKIKCSIPWDVSFPPGVNCITVQARICNCSGVPQPIAWTASGPMPIPTPNGSFILPPFICTNVPIQICRPTNNFPAGSVVRWTLSVFSGTQCPMECVGSVINPGPIIIVVPTDPVGIPGTLRGRNVRLSLNGLPPGEPVRIRAIGPDMQPDMTAISLNGLPPGTPVIIGGGGGFFPAADIVLNVQFVELDPMGLYPILIETDVDGDGQFDTLASFDAENTVVPPPTLHIERGDGKVGLDWQDEGEGLGEIEETDDVVNGPWTSIPGSAPGMTLPTTEKQRFFRVFIKVE